MCSAGLRHRQLDRRVQKLSFTFYTFLGTVYRLPTAALRLSQQLFPDSRSCMWTARKLHEIEVRTRYGVRRKISKIDNNEIYIPKRVLDMRDKNNPMNCSIGGRKRSKRYQRQNQQDDPRHDIEPHHYLAISKPFSLYG
jgi:hypothetical protein